MPRRKSSPAKAKGVTKGTRTKQYRIEMWIDVPTKDTPHPVHWNWKEIAGSDLIQATIEKIPTSERITKDGK